MSEFALLVCENCDKPYAVPSVMITDFRDGGEDYRDLHCTYCGSVNGVSSTFKEHFRTHMKIEKKVVFVVKGEQHE